MDTLQARYGAADPVLLCVLALLTRVPCLATLQASVPIVFLIPPPSPFSTSRAHTLFFSFFLSPHFQCGVFLISYYHSSLVLAWPRCRGVGLGLRPREPSGDFLGGRARIFGWGCHHTSVWDDCDRGRRIVDSQGGTSRAFDSLAAGLRILRREHQLPEQTVRALVA